MKLTDFDYELPSERVAQRPAERRDDARLLVHDVGADATEHRRVSDLVECLRPGDLLVVNDTRVLSARIYGRRKSGGAVELLFLEPVSDDGRRWSARANPARRLKPDETIEVEGGLTARMVERAGHDWLVELADPREPGLGVVELLQRHGRMPLPPYIERGDRARRRTREPEDPLDRERYQTVYAERMGAVAAPTAGLHFTPELLARLEELGVQRATVTLHVGLGTFEPVHEDRVEDHRLHAERFDLPAATVAAVRATRTAGGRVVAVGTTSVRVLESCADERGELAPASGETRLFLLPGSELRVVDVLMTNFHLPRSTLLMLVSAFAGRERVLRLYREAIAEGYRFYSYGDAMLLIRAR